MIKRTAVAAEIVALAIHNVCRENAPHHPDVKMAKSHVQQAASPFAWIWPVSICNPALHVSMDLRIATMIYPMAVNPIPEQILPIAAAAGEFAKIHVLIAHASKLVMHPINAQTVALNIVSTAACTSMHVKPVRQIMAIATRTGQTAVKQIYSATQTIAAAVRTIAKEKPV